MAMTFNLKKNIIRIDVPNSEANIDSQHCGIKDRTVGSYYMSECYDQCLTFLSNFEGEYFIDLALSVRNARTILKELKEKNYQNAFKSKLVPQFNMIEALEWLIKEDGYFYKMNPPSVNENQKYLKFDNEDSVVTSFKTLVLGDLVSVFIQKIGDNGYLIYLDKSPNFKNILDNNTILKWMR